MLKIGLSVLGQTVKLNNVNLAMLFLIIQVWTAKLFNKDQKWSIKFIKIRKCRYCDEPITAKNCSKTKVQALMDICNNK